MPLLVLETYFDKIVVGDIVIALDIQAGTAVVKPPACCTAIEILQSLKRWNPELLGNTACYDAHAALSENIQYFLAIVIHHSESFIASLNTMCLSSIS